MKQGGGFELSTMFLFFPQLSPQMSEVQIKNYRMSPVLAEDVIIKLPNKSHHSGSWSWLGLGKMNLLFNQNKWKKLLHVSAITRTTNACEFFDEHLNGFFHVTCPNILVFMETLLEVLSDEANKTKFLNTIFKLQRRAKRSIFSLSLQHFCKQHLIAEISTLFNLWNESLKNIFEFELTNQWFQFFYFLKGMNVIKLDNVQWVAWQCYE